MSGTPAKTSPATGKADPYPHGWLEYQDVVDMRVNQAHAVADLIQSATFPGGTGLVDLEGLTINQAAWVVIEQLRAIQEAGRVFEARRQKGK
ncbi:MAG: hypothetical protein HQL52_19755 [Magnetococcales bacterium]|nr:hypothetical protein [Magnetococcales bacterium]